MYADNDISTIGDFGQASLLKSVRIRSLQMSPALWQRRMLFQVRTGLLGQTRNAQVI